MPIDADAYMSGHIPALSRGGSWQPDQQSPQEPSIPGPYNHKPGPLSIHPSFGWYAPTIRSPSERPMPSFPHTPTQTIFSPMVPTFTYAPSMSSFTHLDPGHNSWERDSGAPKQISRESSYTRAKTPDPIVVHRQQAESLPSPPPPRTLSGTDLTNRRLGNDKPTVEVRSRTMSARAGQTFEAGHRIKKASMSLRQAHLSGILERHQETPRSPIAHDPISGPHTVPGSNESSATRRSYYAPSARSRIRPSDNEESPIKPMKKRPEPLRRHTSHASSPSKDVHDSLPAPKSASTPTRTAPLSQHTPPSPSLAPVISKAYDMAPLSAALPSAPISVRSRTKSDAPPGYISPNSVYDEYDRYSAHPAAPQPSRSDVRSTSSAGSSMGSRGRVRSTSGLVMMGHSYMPLGYAKPTKELAWNRDGPAMKTHGVAWKRHTDGMVLLAGPQKPTWVQARPPRVEVLSGGSWWASGGQAT